MKRPRNKGSGETQPAHSVSSSTVAPPQFRLLLRQRLGFRVVIFVLPVALTVALCVYALSGNSFIASGLGEDGPASPSSLPVPAVAAAKGDPVTSLWFGDSIVAGCCRTAPSSLNMAEMAAATLGWQKPQVQGFAGTGYVTSAQVEGVTLPAYGKNIGQYLAGSHYRVVIIAGGNNDAGGGRFSPGAFRAGVRSTLAQVKAALPKAQIVVVGPYSPDGTGYAAQRSIESQEAARAEAMFIDGIAEGWFQGQGQLISEDGFSPNDAGQAYLGIRMATKLQKLPLP